MRVSLVPCLSYFLVSKTEDILNYPQRQKATQKRKKCTPSGSFKHKKIRHPPVVIGCEAANWKMRISDPSYGLINT